MPLWARVVIATVALWIRVHFFYGDTMDLATVVGWYGFLKVHGFAAFGTAFSNYAPPYGYLLLAAGRILDWAGAVAAIKLISVAFDVVCALAIHRIVALAHPDDNRPAWIAAGAFLFAPTMILNGAFW